MIRPERKIKKRPESFNLMVKDAAIKAEMIMINGMEERLSNSIRSKSLAKNNS